MATTYRFVVAAILASSVAFPEADCTPTNVLRCFPGGTVFTNTVSLGTNIHYSFDRFIDGDDVWGEDYREVFQLSMAHTNLPAGLVHTKLYGKHDPGIDLTNIPLVSAGTCVVSDWDMYCITGMVSQAAVNTETNFHIHRQQLVSNEVVEEVHVCHLIQVDDFANAPEDTNHLGMLAVLTNWHQTAGYTNGLLFGQTKRPPSRESLDVYCADTDVFYMAGDPGVYCVETKRIYPPEVTEPLPLNIAVYQRDGNNYGDLLASTNAFNVYSNGYKVTMQRVYFTNDTSDGAFIEVSSPDPRYTIQYAIRVFVARPVILIHGIHAGPRQPGDTSTTFGQMRDKLGFLSDIHPCCCYDFPWDSSQDHSGHGFTEYVSPNRYAGLYSFVYNAYHTVHRELARADIVCHSMGGFIVRCQLPEPGFTDMVSHLVFLDSPQYGSDLANAVCDNWMTYRRMEDDLMDTFGDYAADFVATWGTGRVNYNHLCRGGDTVWHMHNNLPLTLPPSRLSCTVGQDGYLLNKTLCYLFDHYSIPYDGISSGDAIVPATSQNMKSLDTGIEAVFLERNHLNCQQLILETFSDRKQTYDLIKQKVNDQ